MKSSIRSVSRRAQAGFTMIELIVVIVILGILAATALPKFIDLRSDATQAAVEGVAGNLGSAMSVNYAGCAAATNAVTAGKCIKVSSCRSGVDLLQGVSSADAATGKFTLGSTEYTIDANAVDLQGNTVSLATNGNTGTCTVTVGTGSNLKSAKFSGIGAAN